MNIRLVHSIRPEDIEAVTVDTYFWAVTKHDHTQINGISSAKMSAPNSVAVASASGKAGLEEYFYEIVRSADIASLTREVAVYADDRLTALVPKKVRLSLTLRPMAGTIKRTG